ncbi:MAG: hypothetical protein KME32_10035 [Mojavia pulchra JT2-VF2]|jgi:hypothetical protein|uniref:DUF2281 domain-containing protein n=1 Tax=Mojavia pulchra JT2-VF2 TaxID=287848 RepID=A0A951PX96_9NOST|nr:hypothetical protein [Mojavia pulchra JT2-VF2]
MLTLEMAIQKIQQLPPEQQKKVIEFVEFLEFQADRQQQDKQPETPAVLETAETSFTAATKEFIGCLDSNLEDLSHNPRYLEEFGRS